MFTLAAQLSRRLPLLVLIAGSGSLYGGEAAWETLVRLEPDKVLDQTQAAPAEEAALATGLAWLNRQPRTQANVRQASGIFDQLATGASSPALRAAAVYHGARLKQRHLEPAQPDVALAAYLALARAYPDEWHAHLGLIRAIPLAAFLDADKAAGLRRLAELEPLAAPINDPALRRNFHLALADCLRRLGAPPSRYYPHTARAAAIPFVARAAGPLALSMAAQHAEEAGDIPAAIGWIDALLQRYPSDERVYALTERKIRLQARQP